MNDRRKIQIPSVLYQRLVQMRDEADSVRQVESFEEVCRRQGALAVLDKILTMVTEG